MSEQKTSYVIYLYLEEFKDVFIIKDDTRFFLNSVRVYGVQSQDKMKFTKIDFDIKKRNDELSIHPLEHFDSYLFMAEKFAEGIKIKTNADQFPLNKIYKYFEIPIDQRGNEAKALWEEIKQDIILINHKIKIKTK